MILKVVFGDWMRAKCGFVFVGFTDYSGFVVEANLKKEKIQTL